MNFKEAIESQGERRMTDWRTTTDIYGEEGVRDVAKELLEEIFSHETSADLITGLYTIVVERQEIRGTDIFSLQASKVSATEKEDIKAWVERWLGGDEAQAGQGKERPDPVDTEELIEIILHMAYAWPQRGGGPQNNETYKRSIAERDLVRRWLGASLSMGDTLHDDDGTP